MDIYYLDTVDNLVVLDVVSEDLAQVVGSFLVPFCWKVWMRFSLGGKGLLKSGCFWLRKQLRLGCSSRFWLRKEFRLECGRILLWFLLGNRHRYRLS